jgi:D-arabinose 1-dehydrogenase-like Zn-dependent alcohol dehydrogenase
MSAQQKFEGWVAEKPTQDQDLVWKEYEIKPFEETDIEIRITHCGVCGTDDHTSRNGWVSSMINAYDPDFNSVGNHFVSHRCWT